MSLVSVSGSLESQKAGPNIRSFCTFFTGSACMQPRQTGRVQKGRLLCEENICRTAGASREWGGGVGRATIPAGFALRLPPQQRPQTTPAQWDPVVPRLGTMPLFSPRTPQPGRMPGTVKLMAIGDFLKTDMPRNLQSNAQDLTAIPAVW